MIYLTSCEGQRNFDNLKRVKKGMNVNEVYQIMGKPKSIEYDSILSKYYSRNLVELRYEPPHAASDDIIIVLTSPDSSVYNVELDLN